MAKTKDLKLVLEIRSIIETDIMPGGEVLPSLTKSLETISNDIGIIQNLDIPEDALEEARRTDTKVRRVSISGHFQQYTSGSNSYIVSYETIRGRELGPCQIYTSEGLAKLSQDK